MRRLDLVGKTFNRLKVISLNEELTKERKHCHWNCICECGSQTVVEGRNLTNNTTKSCGCFKYDKFNKMLKTIDRKGENHPQYGKSRSKTTKEKLKNSHKKIAKRGEESPHWKEHKKKDERVTFRCSNCGKRFSKLNYTFDKKANNRFCSKECLSEFRTTKVESTCPICDKKIWIYNCKKDRSNFCSRECLGIWHSLNLSGKNHPRWKGGITTVYNKIRSSNEYYEWRLSAMKRDDFTCQKCNDIKGHNLNVHHITNFQLIYKEEDKILYDLDNGITLCKKCHKGFHKKYGNKDNNLRQLEEYLC